MGLEGMGVSEVKDIGEGTYENPGKGYPPVEKKASEGLSEKGIIAMQGPSPEVVASDDKPGEDNSTLVSDKQ